MKRKNLHAFLACALLGALAVAVMAGCRGLVAATPPSGNLNGTNPPKIGALGAINHIIILVQENRSFDHYFAAINQYRAAHGLGADVDALPPNSSNPSFDGTTSIPSFHLQTACVEQLSPSWNESHVDANRNDPASNTYTMDGFVKTAAKFAQDNTLNDTQGRRAMGFYTDQELPVYYFAATQFAMSDRWFASAPTRTPPNRLYVLGATSGGITNTPPDSVSFQPIFALLQNANVSWKVYTSDPGGSPTLNPFQPFATEHADNVVDASQFASDAAAGTLPAVSFIDSGFETGTDEHPPDNVQVGAAKVAGFISALINSPSWKDSVFFLTYDEGGGFFDHVPPQPAVSPDGIPPSDLASTDIQGDFTRTGFRVPFIVISPFAKHGFVSHTAADNTALLKFVEERYGLPSLNARDAAQPDITEFFDFSGQPNLNPPGLPTQPTSAPCYFDHLP